MPLAPLLLLDTALCALKELKFLLRAALREALNKNLVFHTLEKCCKTHWHLTLIGLTHC